MISVVLELAHPLGGSGVLLEESRGERLRRGRREEEIEIEENKTEMKGKVRRGYEDNE